MADDLYAALGVAKTATADEIRRAYRKIAKSSHPDLNPGDKAAEDRFKQAQAAYDLLGDAEKRGRYDRGEIDATGAERAEQQFYRRYAETGGGERYQSQAGYADFSDIFSDLFGRQRAGGSEGLRMRGAERRYHLDVEFLDAARGATRRITMPDASTLDVAIPPGVQDGTVLRLRGKGAPGIGGGPAGDALVEIAVRPHAHFRREGDDIEIDLPVTIDEAALGAKVEVPTINGRVSMTVPAGSQTGDVLRLKGRGIKAARGAGDQRVVLRIVMPDHVDPELESFLRGWREKNRHDPRIRLRRET